MARWGWRRGALLAVALAVAAPAVPAHAVSDITLTFTISSTSGADSRNVSIYGPSGSYLFDETDGTTLQVTGQPGPYSVEIEEYGGPQGEWAFYGHTVNTTYSANATVPVAVPLHTLALDVKDGAGAAAQADISLTCDDAHPSGWSTASSSADRTVNGATSILVADHGLSDDPCQLTVDPVTGADGTALIPGNATSFTYVVQEAITVTYQLSSIATGALRDVTVTRPSGTTFFDESDGNSLSVTDKKGQYGLTVSEYAGAQGDWSFTGTRTPKTYTADATVPVTVPLHQLALDVEYANGDPAPASVSLSCPDAHPSGWDSTSSYASRDVNGPSAFLVANHAAGDDPCSLSVDPTVGESGDVEVPGNASAFTYVVQDSNDITITFNLSSPSNAADRAVTVFGPDETYSFDESAGSTFSVAGPPGEYKVRIFEDGGPQGDGWHFSGQTVPATYTTSTTVPISVPLHTLALTVQKPGGAAAAASVDLSCTFGDPAGWAYATSSTTRDVNGTSSFLVADRGPTGEDCPLVVRPVGGPVSYATVPGSASSFTYTLPAGAHVTGTVSDGLGDAAPANVGIGATNADGQPSGSAATDAAGHYDLLVAVGSHVVNVPFVTSPQLRYRLRTNPVSVTADRTLDLAPVTDPLTVHLRTAAVGGTRVPSTVRLECSGTPLGQSLIADQVTSTPDQTGSDFVLPATATSDGGCDLDVDPTVGVRQSTPVVVPDGGGEITVVVDPGVSFSGQVTVPGIAGFGNTTVNVSPDGHESDFQSVAADGSFSFSGLAAGDATFTVTVDEPWGHVQFSRRVTLHEGDVFALAPHLDYLDLYLLDASGNDGTGTAKLQCSGTRLGDVNTLTSVATTRSGTGTIRLPGYAVAEQKCHLTVTWSDTTVTQLDVALDPAADTAFTLLKNGVLLTGDPTASNDDDGVADATEAYAPNQGDGDADGTKDYEEAHVASLPEEGAVLGSGEDYVTVSGPATSTLGTVVTDTVNPAPRGSRRVVTGPPDGTELPRGYLDFTVKDVALGSTQTVVLHYQATSEFNSFSTFDPTAGTWSQLPADRVVIGTKTVTLTLTDGGVGDVDGQVNGRIRHPGGGTKVDEGLPVVTGAATTAPNDKGWYAGDVTVAWTVLDDKDTITPPAQTVVTTEGDDVTATSSEACDRRGNCAVGTVKHLKIDKTKPVVTLSGPAAGATYVVGAAPGRSCQATDAGGSGVPDGGACVVTVTGAAGGKGVGTVTVTAKATDRAGNTATRTVSYKQVYKAGGLVAPAAGSKLKVFEKGSTVVVRLKLLNASGGEVTPGSAPVWVAPKASGKSKGKVNQPVSDVKPDKGAVLVKRGAFWEYRWGTSKAKKGKAYLITVRLDDGTTRTVTVGIG